MEEARGTHAKFSLFFRLSRIRHRKFQSTEASVLCNNLSTVVTCEHANSASGRPSADTKGGAKTSYIEHVFLHPAGYAGHVVNYGASGA
jgi:hypothetical protein